MGRESSKLSAVVPAKAGTHNLRRRLRATLWLQLLSSRTSVVMGPGSRFACPGRRKLFPRRDAPGVLLETLPSEIQRAQGRPGARRTRGLACNVHQKMRTRAYRFGGNTPAFPAQWLYGLDVIVLVTGFLAKGLTTIWGDLLVEAEQELGFFGS